MLARIQQVIAFLLVAVMAASAAIAIWFDRPLWVVGVISTMVIAYACVLAIEFALSRRAFAPGDEERPSIAQLASAWLIEATGTPRTFLWRQPFRSKAEADFLPRLSTERRPVLLVHGYFCNRGIWNPWLRWLRAQGTPVVAVNLEPVFASIDSYGACIDDAIRKLEGASSLAPVLVCHSMGGLAARAWLNRPGNLERCQRLVTIATPHAGTRLAGHGFGANVRQMQSASAWLAALDANTLDDARARLTCFWSHCDNIVVPARSATVAGADNRHLPATPHVQMIHHPAVWNEVAMLLEGPERRAREHPTPHA